jgi:alpha-ketoglutarate-dependent taurine dioxygenase
MTFQSKAHEFPVDDMFSTLEKQGFFVNQFSKQIDLCDWVTEIGGVPVANNLSENSVIWDVMPRADVKNFVRSHGIDEFPLHTDASYEANPPKYVGLFVVKEDSKGGGLTLVSDSSKILTQLSHRSLIALNSELRIRVPPEYQKSGVEIEVPLIWNKKIRYRRELLIEPNEDVLHALDEFEFLAKRFQQKIMLRENSLLIFDNHRLLHGRTRVLDKQRHLKRIKFNVD